MHKHGDHVSIVFPTLPGPAAILACTLNAFRSLHDHDGDHGSNAEVMLIARDSDGGLIDPEVQSTRVALIPNETIYDTIASVQLWSRAFVCVMVHEIRCGAKGVRTGM